MSSVGVCCDVSTGFSTCIFSLLWLPSVETEKLSEQWENWNSPQKNKSDVFFLKMAAALNSTEETQLICIVLLWQNGYLFSNLFPTPILLHLMQNDAVSGSFEPLALTAGLSSAVFHDTAFWHSLLPLNNEHRLPKYISGLNIWEVLTWADASGQHHLARQPCTWSFRDQLRVASKRTVERPIQKPPATSFLWSLWCSQRKVFFWKGKL